MTIHPSRDEFASITESTPLVDELHARIARHGPITFREFMDAALYHPRYGYYMAGAEVTTRAGDYVTSPEVHPVFGTLVAKQIIELWRALDRPATFTVVEAGAGRGALARDVLVRAAREPDFGDALRYRIWERSPRAQATQHETLSEAAMDHYVEWSADSPRDIVGCILTNELIDAFPVHRLFRSADGLREVYVASDGRGFRDQFGPLSDPRLTGYFDALGLVPGMDCYAEANLDAPAWIAEVARSLRRGYVLTFDYGYEAVALYAPWRRDGTLLCFYRQSVSSDPYQRIGKQDMTASVDFTTLRMAGETAGLRTVGMTDQAAFLVGLGIAEGVAAIANDRSPQIEEYFARRNVVLDLIDPAKLGRIKVLLQGKDAPEAAFTGLTDA